MGTVRATQLSSADARRVLLYAVVAPRVPEIALIHLDEAFSRSERHQEIQDLLRASIGLNLGLRFLPGSFGFDSGCAPDPEAAARVIWLDALTANVDRSWRNPNTLLWHRELWLIDHGASLYFHHSWRPEKFPAATYRFDAADHLMLPFAGDLAAVDAELTARVTPDLVREVPERVDQGGHLRRPQAGEPERRIDPAAVVGGAQVLADHVQRPGGITGRGFFPRCWRAAALARSRFPGLETSRRSRTHTSSVPRSPWRAGPWAPPSSAARTPSWSPGSAPGGRSGRPR